MTLLPSVRNREVRRGIETLRGLLAGISCDYEISDAEIGRISEWLQNNANLLNIPPFSDLHQLLSSILKDQVIDSDERDELLQWCHDFVDPAGSPIEDITNGIQRLHGFLQGIAADRHISDGEVADLRDWLEDYHYIRDYWPFDDVWALVGDILEDNFVSEEERQRLTDYCQNFRETYRGPGQVKDEYDPKAEAFMHSTAPVLKTIDAVCENEPSITFEGKIFCFTGRAASGKRKDLETVTKGLGGMCINSIRNDLNYLVIGALSQPVWAYATYGRKIEAAMERNKAGADICIIRENDFTRAATEALDG